MASRHQSIAPVLLTPIILWLIFTQGSDKTATLIVPWFVFCSIYYLFFRLYLLRATYLVVIPWRHAYAHYVKARGDRWT